MSLYGAWPIDPSSACVTAINTLISELSGPRKRFERRPFSCSITLRALSCCPTLVLDVLSVFHITPGISGWNKKHDFTFSGELEERTTFTPILWLIVMGSPAAPGVGDCPRQMHSHTCSQTHAMHSWCCGADTDCGIHLHTVIYMWNA